MKQNLCQGMAGVKSSSSYSSSSLPSPLPSSSSKLCACVQLLQDVAGFKYVRSYTATSMYATGLTMYVRNKGWMEGGALPDLENLGVGDADGPSRTWTDVANMMMV